MQDAIDGTCKRFEEKVDTFLDKVYPVGSIYISYSSTNPADFFGEEWVVYGDGRVLKGISSGEAGKTGAVSIHALLSLFKYFYLYFKTLKISYLK